MNKKYVVRLNDQEREELKLLVAKLAGSNQKVRRANILLQADVDGPAWIDKQIAQAYRCRTKTVENVRQRFVERGFHETLEGKRPDQPRVLKYSTENKRPKLSLCAWDPRQKAMPTGHYDYWPARS